MVSETEVSILKHIEIPEAHIKVRSDKIIHVHYKKNTVLDVELQERMRVMYMEITGGQKSKFIFSADEGFVLTKEARENSVRIEAISPISYYALVAPNLAYRLIANFYFKVVNPKPGYKICSSLESAARWLKTL